MMVLNAVDFDKWEKRVIFFCVFFEVEDEKRDKNVEIATWVLNAHVGGGSNCLFPFIPIDFWVEMTN